MGIEGRKQSKGEKEKLVERERSSMWQLSHPFFREWQVLDGAAINKDEAKAVKFLETREPHSFKKVVSRKFESFLGKRLIGLKEVLGWVG